MSSDEPFQCPYAEPGQRRCSPSICDCFIEQYPDDPFGLHPEAFLVNGHQYDLHGHAATCPHPEHQSGKP